MNAEKLRLQEAKDKQIPWRLWGPYLSERQWGTVREDYSKDGSALEHTAGGKTVLAEYAMITKYFVLL
jgi:hypothetical protein